MFRNYVLLLVEGLIQLYPAGYEGDGDAQETVVIDDEVAHREFIEGLPGLRDAQGTFFGERLDAATFEVKQGDQTETLVVITTIPKVPEVAAPGLEDFFGGCTNVLKRGLIA